MTLTTVACHDIMKRRDGASGFIFDVSRHASFVLLASLDTQPSTPHVYWFFSMDAFLSAFALVETVLEALKRPA